MSEKQRKSSERNGMPKVLLAAGLSAAALTGCANGEAEPVETPKPTPTSITLETSEMQELNDTVKGLVMAGYEDMKNSVSPDEAADLVVKGIIEKPSRIATRLGIFSALINAVAPKAYEVVMNTAFELFPDSAAAKGDKKALRDETPSQEQIAFAALMRGVHW